MINLHSYKKLYVVTIIISILCLILNKFFYFFFIYILNKLSLEVILIEQNLLITILNLKQHIYLLQEINFLKQQLSIIEINGNFLIKIMGIFIFLMKLFGAPTYTNNNILQTLIQYFSNA